MYVRIRIERYIMHTYVGLCSLHLRAKLTEHAHTERQRSKSREREKEKETERERDRETDTDDNKAQEIAPYLFSFIRESLFKATSQLAKICLSTN